MLCYTITVNIIIIYLSELHHRGAVTSRLYNLVSKTSDISLRAPSADVLPCDARDDFSNCLECPVAVR